MLQPNPTLPEGPPHCLEAGAALQLLQPEEALTTLLGRPHNFQGFPGPEVGGPGPEFGWGEGGHWGKWGQGRKRGEKGGGAHEGGG